MCVFFFKRNYNILLYEHVFVIRLIISVDTRFIIKVLAKAIKVFHIFLGYPSTAALVFYPLL